MSRAEGDIDSSTVEKLVDEEAQRQIQDEREPIGPEEEINLTGQPLEPDKPAKNVLRQEPTNQEAAVNDREQGTIRETIYDTVLYEIEEVLGYDADAENTPLIGELTDQQMTRDQAKIQYTIKEPLVNTATEIETPVLQNVDTEVLQQAYQRSQVDIDITETEEGYQFTFTYEEPESINQAASQVSLAIGEMEQELKNAYQLQK